MKCYRGMIPHIVCLTASKESLFVVLLHYNHPLTIRTPSHVSLVKLFRVYSTAYIYMHCIVLYSMLTVASTFTKFQLMKRKKTTTTNTTHILNQNLYPLHITAGGNRLCNIICSAVFLHTDSYTFTPYFKPPTTTHMVYYVLHRISQ